jgi:hypothetical protein
MAETSIWLEPNRGAKIEAGIQRTNQRMSYRFLKIQSIEPVYLRPFLARHPDYKHLSYSELFNLYIKDCSGWNLNYPTHLASLGNEAHDICVNFEFLQKLWATENGVNYNERNWLQDILVAQLKAFQPDVVLLDDLYVLDHSFRQILRERSPGKVKIIGWRAAPTEDYSIFRDVDLMLTCTPLFAERMRNHGVRAEVLLHAFEPAILDMVERPAMRDVDFSFVGTIALKNGFHNERLALLKSLLAVTNLMVWGSVFEQQNNSLAKRVIGKLQRQVTPLLDSAGFATSKLRFLNEAPAGPETLELLRTYPGRIHEPVVSLDYFRLLARSKITLNKHIDCAEQFAGNVRLFEATGMACCLLTDWKVNLGEMFESDVEIVTYRTTDECAEKALYLLDHEDELQKIAAYGQRRTLRDHTYAKRAEQVDGIIRELIST